MSQPVIYIVSDSLGETAELVVRAAESQFNGGQSTIRRIPYVMDEKTIVETVEAAKEENALIVFTLVVPELQAALIETAKELHVAYIDLMGPMIDQMALLFKKPPRKEPGLIHKLDAEYFRKVEAIEFAVKYDDGRDPRGLLRADIVLIGVSRTSKTPLSMYLAHKGFKVANVPLVPEVEPPNELFVIPSEKCIGLTIDPQQLTFIRRERLKSLGLASGANYATMKRVLQEIEFAEKVIKKVACPTIDVSNKAVEETASIILDIIKKGRK